MIEDDIIRQKEARAKGDKARHILENPVWQEAWADFESFIFEQFKKTESRDTELLAHWKRMHVCGLQLKIFFERTVQEGEFAVKDLEFKEKTGVIKRFVRSIS